MKKALRRVVKTLLTLTIIAAGLLIWKWDEVKRLLAVNSLFEEQNIVENFSNMGEIFFSTILDVPDLAPTPLPIGPANGLDNLSGDLERWINERAVTGIVVLKNGNIAYENYFLGTNAEDLRISWSVAKSYLSALFGILLEEGAIESINDPVIKYAPELANSAYSNATILNVLNMASGVKFDEDYLDFNSDINKMGRVLALGGSMDEFSINITDTINEPGKSWQYVSIDTHILGMVMRGATGRSIPELMVEKLLTPMGLEADPIMLTDGDGVAFVLGGLNLRTRDYARLGQLYIQDGLYNGQQIVPISWLITSILPTAPTDAGAVQYGYQWWIPADANPLEFFARGIYGQYIYVDKMAGVVIAVNSADRGFREAGSFDQNLAAFREIVATLN